MADSERIIQAVLPDVPSALEFVGQSLGPMPLASRRIGQIAGRMPPTDGDVAVLRKLSVLMPVYNQRWTLREAIGRVLNSPVPLEIEVVVVDDASDDGSSSAISELADADPRIHAVRHPQHRGKGAAIRTAIGQMTGDVAVVQDADLQYDPGDYPLLLEPILQGKADAVFGSRFTGPARPVLSFWHGLGNRLMTFLSNAINNLSLSDVQTGYKMVRADVLKQLRLTSDTHTLDPEITCRLAQWGARIYEVPIGYSGRTFQEGKKTDLLGGLKALGQMIRCKLLAPRFTDHSGYYTLASVSRATAFNRWVLAQVRDYLGQRVLEAGCGIGNLSALLLDRQRLVLADREPMYVGAVRRRFGHRENVRIDLADLTDPACYGRWKGEQLDTILCANVLEHLDGDEAVLTRFHETLHPGGHCAIVVPAGQWLYCGIDRELGHRRRYSRGELVEKMTSAGFDVVFTRQFCRLGALSWAISGGLLRRRHLSPRQMIWFDRLLPLVKLLEHVLPVPGMSLIAVGRKPRRAAWRMAA